MVADLEDRADLKIIDNFILLLRGVPLIAFILDLQAKADEDNIGLLAAGMSFYFLLAAFPAIAALVSLYGLFSDPQTITAQFESFSMILPEDAYRILTAQAEKVASAHNGALSFGVVIGLFVAMYGASRGIRALIRGLNVVYDIDARRNLLVLNATIFILTFTMLFYFVLALILLAAVPLTVSFFFSDMAVLQFLSHLRWPVLFLLFVGGLDIIYYLAPAHPAPQWRWFSPGAVTATVLWLGCSMGLSLFVARVANYNETYGSLGTVVALMVWFWISGLTILLGAEVNALRAVRRAQRVSL